MKFRIRLIATIITLVLVSVFSTIEITSYIVNIQISDEFSDSIKSTATMAYNYFDAKIWGDWSVRDGELYKGTTCLNDNNELVDYVKEQTDYYITFFAGDIRVATNIMSDGERVVGTAASQKVVDQVLKNGESFQGQVDVVGNELDCVYLPLKNDAGEVIGMFFVGTPRITMNKSELHTTLVTIVVLLILLLAIIVTTICYLNGIMKAVGSNVRQLNRMSQKDFTSKIHNRLIKRKDEFGSIFKATANMQTAIGAAVGDIRMSTDQVNDTIDHTTKNLSDLDDTILHISATTQEMAASFEETAASTEEINASIIEMKRAMEEVSSQVKESEQQAQLSEKKSLQVKEEAKNSIHNTLQMIDHNRELVTKAIEQSKSIDQISRLSDAISDIASETNLLSLNASIEAARAGENGRSFSIVANQIKSLSDSSQKAVTEIQSVVQVVLESVQNLAMTSKELMDFIDHKVTGDYKILEATGEEYYDSTLYFTNVLKEISVTSEQLLKQVDQVTDSVDEVTNATNENSASVNQIADNISNIGSKANDVLQLMKDAEDVSRRLDGITSSFKTQIG